MKRDNVVKAGELVAKLTMLEEFQRRMAADPRINSIGWYFTGWEALDSGKMFSRYGIGVDDINNVVNHAVSVVIRERIAVVRLQLQELGVEL